MDLKKKQESQVQLLKQKQKSDEAAKRLQDEIQCIKAQKVDCCISSNQGYKNLLIYYLCYNLNNIAGSIAAKDKTRIRTVSAVEGFKRERVVASMTSFLFFQLTE